MRELVLNPKENIDAYRLVQGKNVLILGAGGVTSSIIYTLSLTAKELKYTSRNRTKEKAQQLKKKDLTGKLEVIGLGAKELRNL